MRRFEDIYQTAILHKGGASVVESLLPKAKSPSELAAISDDRYLSHMCRRIFRAGLKHSMVDAKWPNFEVVFNDFDPFSNAMLSDEDLEVLMQDKRIIRHMGKIRAVRENACFVREIAAEFGGFGQFLGQWPTEDIVGLWALLKKRGKQLGGNSGASFLRMVGKDTFLLTRDVIAVLKAEGIITKEPTAKRDLQLVQNAFNTWQQQSSRSLCEISRIVSLTVLF